MNEPQVTTTTTTFSPPRPCATIQGAGLCGKEATAGFLYPIGGGQYILQPLCKDCVAAMQRNYGLDAQEASGS